MGFRASLPLGVVALGAILEVAACSSGYAEAEDAAASTDSAAPPPEAGDAGGSDAGQDAPCEELVRADFTTFPASFIPSPGNSGTVAIDTGRFVSGPSALHATAPVTGSGGLQASIERELLLDPSAMIEVAYSVYVAGAAQYAELGCTTDLRTKSAALARIGLARVSGAYIESYYGTADGGTGTRELANPADAWRAARLTIQSATDGSVTFVQSLDGVALAPMTIAVGAFDRVRITCGIDYAVAADGGAAEVWIDDLVVRRCGGQ